MTQHQPAAPAHRVHLRVVRLGGTALVLAVFAAAMWFAWLGWDHEYYRVNGVAQGPYRAWQVLGCALSMSTAAILAYLWAPSVWAVFVLAAAADIGFAIPWALNAASTDDSGLWVVGLLFLLVGTGLGLLAVLTITAVAAARRRPRPRTKVA